MAAVIFEGGSLRGIFSAGVMDALLENKIHFDYIIGVSAGISYGISYASKQKGRNLEVLCKYRNDHRYLSKRNFIRCRSLFDLDFLFDKIPNELVILDRKAIINHKGSVIGVVTDAETGEAVYMDAKHMDKGLTILRASSAIPFYTPPIYIDGKRYFDGGLKDSIPIKKSIADGNTKNLIVLTQPIGYIKKSGKSAKLGAALLKRKYPKLAEVLLNRAENYNDTTKFIKDLQKKSPDNTVILAPEYSLNSFESDLNELKKTYKHGYDITIQNIEKIRKLF